MMKKIIKLAAVLCVFLSLSACTESRFMNFGDFVGRYNELAEAPLDFADFIRKEENGLLCHELCLQENRVLVKLFSDGEKLISQCTIAVAKTDKNGNSAEISQSLAESFLSQANLVAKTFTGGECRAVSASLGLSGKDSLSAEREKTAEEGDFYFVYLSNSLLSEIIIYNKNLHPVEQTEKPENKAPFDDIGETRNFTVPHS